jgi:hypothetical protein
MSMHGVTKASSAALSPASRFREKSFKLDGVEDRVEMDAVAASGVLDWDHTKKWSVSIWFKDPGTDLATLWSVTRSVGNFRWLEMYTNYSGATGQVGFRGYADSTNALLASGTTLAVNDSATNGILPNDGNWHNVVLTVDSASGATGGTNIYLDGLLAGTGNNGARQNDFEYMKVGARVSNGDNTSFYSPMVVSQFSVYNDELSAAQVANVWAGGNSIDERGLTPAPVHFYRYGNDGAVFPNAVDIGSVGANGRAENMTGLEVVAEHPS